ncbi:glycosyltransferase family 2 protein [Lentisphaerota bacterium ZTH]|nr:glycosyltransferase family 2 protein [Lentisphaerota bacterium]WET07522.1 glycosyltransferase family 2 protein [Lentisphaerota bacterium ZTH]
MELKNRLSVIIPVYNEGKTVNAVIERVQARPETGEIIIVEDASTDNTRESLKVFEDQPDIKIFYQEKNLGKGAAVTRGIAEATKDFIIIQDADFEYTPEDWPAVLAPLADGRADVVYGSRFMGTPGMVRYFRHEMGNKFLTFISNLFSDIHLSDMETCYKAFRREVVQNLNLESKRFGIEVEFTAKLARARILRIWEVPISYSPRRYSEGKKITWKDGISALYHIVKFNVFMNSSKFYKQPWAELLGRKTR